MLRAENTSNRFHSVTLPVCLCVDYRQANKSPLILQATWLIALRVIQVLKHALMCFFSSPLLTFLPTRWVMITPLYEHTSKRTSHTHTHKPTSASVKAQRGSKSSFYERDLMEAFPWTPDRLLVYFPTHHLLYVPSLSFSSDKEQTRAIDHHKSPWIIQGARGLMRNVRFDPVPLWCWRKITKWSILQHQGENGDYFNTQRVLGTSNHTQPEKRRLNAHNVLVFDNSQRRRWC